MICLDLQVLILLLTSAVFTFLFWSLAQTSSTNRLSPPWLVPEARAFLLHGHPSFSVIVFRRGFFPSLWIVFGTCTSLPIRSPDFQRSIIIRCFVLRDAYDHEDGMVSHLWKRFFFPRNVLGFDFSTCYSFGYSPLF